MGSDGQDHNDDEFFFGRKILSRSSSAGCSSRVNFYYRSPEGVPFNWEKEPGTPKIEPPSSTPLPPLSPPPALLSLALPKPCVEDHQPKEDEFFWIRSRLKILKKIIKKCQPNRLVKNKLYKDRKNKDVADHQSEGVGDAHNGVDGVESFGFWSSDRDDFEGSSPPRDSSSSSLSSGTLSTGGPPPVTTVESPTTSFHHPSLSCVPWKLSAIAVYVSKRI